MKKVLITGASSGIGLAIANKLLEKKDLQIIGIARDFSKTSLLKEERFHPYEIDLSQIDSLPDKMKTLLKKHPEIDSLVLCAGAGVFGKIEQISFSDIKSLIELNFLSVAYIVKAFLPFLKQKETANIIFIGSTAAINGRKEGSIYCSSKFALRGFAQALKEECSSTNVKTAIIHPDMVNTSFYKDLHFEPQKGPLYSLEAEDIAEIVQLILDLKSRVLLDEIILSPKKKCLNFKKNNNF